jgi:hypothetical protein
VGRGRASFFVAILTILVLAASAESAPRTGQWLWRFVAGGGTVGSAAFGASGDYYFAAEDRYLYALDTSGVMRWRTDLGRRPSGSVGVGAEGSIYAGLENGELVALNKDGRLLWRRHFQEGELLAPILLPSGVVLASERSGTISAVTHTGRDVWSLRLDGRIAAAPIVAADGLIYACLDTGYVVQADTNGALLGEQYLAEIGTALAASESGVVVGSRGGRVILLDTELTPAWRADLRSPVKEISIDQYGNSFVVTEAGELVRISPDGSIAWTTGSGSASVLGVAAGDSVLNTMSNNLLSRIGPGGGLVWEMATAVRPGSPSVAPYGAVVFPSETWVTYAYPTDFDLSGEWPLPRGTVRNSGVSPAYAAMRADPSSYADSVEYAYLRRLLYSRFVDEQTTAMSQIRRRVDSGDNLAGSYHYMLELCETVAGAPFFGPVILGQPLPVDRRTREVAIGVLGTIGDLGSARFLARLIHYEPDTTLQTAAINSLASLGTALDGALAARLLEIIDRDSRRETSDSLAESVIGLVEAVNAFEGAYVTQEMIDALLTIADSNYSRSTRMAALSALRDLGSSREP